MEALGISLGYILIYITSFVILYLVLKEWIYKPILNMLDKRRATIARGMEDAREAADARANAEKDAASIVSEAQVKAASVIREAVERAEVSAREIVAKAEADAAKKRSEALSEVEQERNRMLAELRSQVASLAIAAAQKLIGESLDEKRQRALVDEFFSGVKSGKVVLLEGETLTGTEAEVTSALPLSTSEQNSVKADISHILGGQPQVEFLVDPSLLGGLVLRVGDKVVDGSVSGKLQTLRQNLH